MTNEKLVLSIVPADNLAAYNCALEVARKKDEQYKLLLDAKDQSIIQTEMDFNSMPISKLGGWHTEPPTKDCTVLLYITEQTLTVSTWSSPNNMFYDTEYKPIKKWTKWKKI